MVNRIRSVQDSVWTTEFDMKHLKKAEGHINRNVVIMTIKTSVNSPNILSNNNYQASSKNFRWIMFSIIIIIIIVIIIIFINSHIIVPTRIPFLL